MFAVVNRCSPSPTRSPPTARSATCLPLPGAHVFVAGDEHLDDDAVFGVKTTLIAPSPRHDPGTAPDGRTLHMPYHTLEYDRVLRHGGSDPGAAAHAR